MQNLHFERLVPFFGQFGMGFLVTVETTIVAACLSFLFAILLASMRMTNIKILVWIHDIWVLMIRSLPLLLQLFLMAYAIPGLTGGKINFGAIFAGELTLAINSSAYMTESIRGGFLGVDKGQKEAAMALGISSVTTFCFITLPQAFKHILPAMMNEFILELKSSSMLAQIGVCELFLVAHNMQTATNSSFESYLFIAIIYYIVVMLLAWGSRIIERRLRRSDRN